MTRRNWLTHLALGAATPALCAAAPERKLIARPGLYRALTEPPCSYCSTQHRKGLVAPNARVVAWLRAAHQGGAIPLTHFLAAPRVINDTYGLFFFDADGGYVSAYQKDYGYEFYGWRGGVMVARGRDGSLWSCLTGRAFSGPQSGKRLVRIPSLTTEWSYWLMLHPESTAYDLFDGRRYPTAPIPGQISPEARESMGPVDGRLPEQALVCGVEANGEACAVMLEGAPERACFNIVVGQKPVAVFWYGATRTATAFSPTLDDRRLTLYADDVSPETAPFKDRETGTRWSIAGRGIDGPHRGRELTWVDSLQCRWFAWSSELPETAVKGMKA